MHDDYKLLQKSMKIAMEKKMAQVNFSAALDIKRVVMQTLTQTKSL